MGRPALGMKATQVRLPQDTLHRIDAVAGQYGRAGFIRQAVDAELAKRESDTAKP